VCVGVGVGVGVDMCVLVECVEM